MGVPPEELPADTEQPLVTPHGTGNKDFQGIGQNCLARGAAGCCDAPSPWTPNNGISQSHDRNFEAFSSCLSRFSPASPLLGTGSRAERKWEHDSHPHPGQLGPCRGPEDEWACGGVSSSPSWKKLNSQSRREDMSSCRSCKLKFH